MSNSGLGNGDNHARVGRRRPTKSLRLLVTQIDVKRTVPIKPISNRRSRFDRHQAKTSAIGRAPAQSFLDAFAMMRRLQSQSARHQYLSEYLSGLKKSIQVRRLCDVAFHTEPLSFRNVFRRGR
jgi:poly(3-hydroxyalkanoate) synthetase